MSNCPSYQSNPKSVRALGTKLVHRLAHELYNASVKLTAIAGHVEREETTSARRRLRRWPMHDDVTAITCRTGALVFKPRQAIMTVDRVMAAVSIVHDMVQREADDNEKLSNAWLVLQLAGEKLRDLRDGLEKAGSVEARAER